MDKISVDSDTRRKQVEDIYGRDQVNDIKVLYSDRAIAPTNKLTEKITLPATNERHHQIV